MANTSMSGAGLRRSFTIVAAILAAMQIASTDVQAGSPKKPLESAMTDAVRVVAGFEEPLVAIGPTTLQEDIALDAAIDAYRRAPVPTNDFAENAKPFNAFLKTYPSSAWRPAIDTNLGLGYYRAGYFSDATAAWQQAWDAGRNSTSPATKALVDRAVGELARMHARVGHADELEKLFADIGKRSMSGPATEMIAGAHEGLWMFQNDPGKSYLCGPMALKNLLIFLKADSASIKHVEAARSGEHGFTMAQVSQLASEVGQRHRLIYRSASEAVPVPSIINWKVNHYAAIIGEKDGRYHVQDPTFASGDLWVSKHAIDSEGSGYYLVPENSHPSTAWRTATAKEAQQVYGMGYTAVSQPSATTPNDVGLNNAPTCGMCVVNAKTMLVSLNLNDTPVGYAPPIGPAPKITLTYNQREASQPANFGFSNVSSKWTTNIMSWVQDNPGFPGQSVSRYVAGGGSVDYSTGYIFNSGTGAYSPERQGQAVLVRIPATGAVTSYELRMPDGSKQIFGQMDGATVVPRRVFLTKIMDPAGNALTLNYDGQLRISTVTDATGRNTVLSYASSNPFLITQITDPFGRHADLTYDQGGRLVSIKDVLGLVSSFTYDAGGLVNTMSTPYGTSRFAYGQNYSTRFLNMTDPLGFTERIEFNHFAPGAASSDPVAPAGLSEYNIYLNYRNTYYWDKNVYSTSGTDYSKARITHWLHNSNGQTSPVIESTRQPLERRVWNTYPNQYYRGYFEGSAATPTEIARVLDNGVTQAYQFTYNVLGKLLTKIDPAGRKTVYTYSADGVDLVRVQQITGVGGALSTLAAISYNTQHLPISYTDAAGQTTRITYNARGQQASVTDPLNQTTRFSYDGFGYLATVFNALGRSDVSFTYDGFGRVATRTDSAGHTVGLQYDALDRLVRTNYPDGTSTQSVWDKLDLVAVIDRLGRQTRYTYDANRNLTMVTDAQARQTTFAYYPNGRLQSMTDPQGSTTSWARDLQSRLTARIYPDNSRESYIYELTTSRLKAVTDAANQARGYAYTVDDKIAAVAYANSTAATPPVSISYDPFFPRVSAMADGSGTTQYQYGAIGFVGAMQLTAEISPFQNGMTAYQYDGLNRVTARTIGANSTETFAYDPLGRIVGASNDLGQFNYGYLGDTSQRTSQNLGGAVGTTWSYESNVNDRRLSAVTNNGAARSYQYTSTPENRITRLTETLGIGGAITPQTWDYSYDASDRLLNGQAQSGFRYSYSYDAADNITAAHGPIYARNTTYNRANQSTSVNGTGVTHSASGNIVDDGERTYQWDGENRLVGIVYKAQLGKHSAFRYDGLGRRIAIIETSMAGSSETRYLWCGEKLCQARGANDLVTRRYFDEGEAWSSNATRLYYSKDRLGSVRDVLAAQNGSRVASYDYDPYGNTTQAQGRVSTDFRYAGMFYHSASGLYLTKFRAYDPKAGRWLSRDPIKEVGGPNLYSYVKGNPVSFNDPLGLLNLTVGAGGAAVGIAAGADYSSGFSYNFERGNINGYTTTGAGAGIDGGQSGLYAGAGITVALIKGDASNVGGPFVNYTLAIPGTNFSVSLFTGPDGSFQGVGAGYGPGIGFARTSTNTDLYPIRTPEQCSAR